MAEAISQFRDVRMHEPLEQYLEAFDEYRDAVENLIEGTVDLSRLSDQTIEYLTDPDLLTAVRYLASPAISEDDLKVLAEAVLTPTRLRKDTDMARRVIDTVLLGLDRNRFPWVSEEREPTDSERETAIVSTAALIATQKVQTSRRTQSKDEQEDSVAEYLKAHSFTEVPRRTVANVSHLPAPGEFCRESLFGTRKADLIVRLWDGRTMPCECKVSNSSTNSVKRLNNDAAVKAKTWLNEFGTTNAVPAAVLSGVFKVHNLRTAQHDGLTIFWAHRLEAMIEFINKGRPFYNKPRP
ncbi:XamI family restriction endonuclease [Amycolatopsis sp.]|uniref:XamI family restriction endonuclease n=1 Tax=Amycolatopsis sp. TaxID=37632 RepID=UPI002C494C04|nr:XamI family restriction endonuclease [Amycolatopsis sp.]HVV11806.1 XamI family restriction endonuclease [Amycolatopsis sp.]